MAVLTIPVQVEAPTMALSCGERTLVNGNLKLQRVASPFMNFIIEMFLVAPTVYVHLMKYFRRLRKEVVKYILMVSVLHVKLSRAISKEWVSRNRATASCNTYWVTRYRDRLARAPNANSKKKDIPNLMSVTSLHVASMVIALQP